MKTLAQKLRESNDYFGEEAADTIDKLQAKCAELERERDGWKDLYEGKVQTTDMLLKQVEAFKAQAVEPDDGWYEEAQNNLEEIHALRAKVAELERREQELYGQMKMYEQQLGVRIEQVEELTSVLAEMELHFRGYEDSDGYTKQLFAKVREIVSANQSTPAAEPSAPFTNCKYQQCDLPGQCKSEGKCHHPAAERRVPDGYVLVPIEPTEEMVNSGEITYAEWENGHCVGPIYNAMLAAAPKEQGK